MGGIFDEFRHLVADIGDLELYVSLLTKKSATVKVVLDMDEPHDTVCQQ